MKRWLKVTIAGSAALAVLGLGAAAPIGLRRMDSFNVRRVEVRGTHFLPPHQALSATGITRASNIFDDFTPWRDSLVKHALVTSARIEREFPGTIRILVEEAEPIALVAGADADAGVLTAVAPTGELLPIDPSQIDLDLPVVSLPASTAPAASAPAADTANSPRAAVLHVLSAIKAAEPALYGWISQAEPVERGVRIWLRSPAGAQAMLPLEPQPARLRQLRLTLADLAARQDIARLIRIDARYHDQIVVTLTQDRESRIKDRGYGGVSDPRSLTPDPRTTSQPLREAR